MSGVSGASEQKLRATEWPVKTLLSETRNAPLQLIGLDWVLVRRDRRQSGMLRVGARVGVEMLL